MIPYVGGKSYLAKWIIEQFPAGYERLTYCEVFDGGGWVLYKKEPSYLEVYNDLNKNLVNLFRVIRDDYKRFHYTMQWSLHSREMYKEACRNLAEDTGLSQLERAMYYAIDRGQAFSGFGGWTRRLTSLKPFSGKWRPFLKRLAYINARLKKIQIECLDFERCISEYDSPQTLFYLDPPYMDCEHYYKTSDVQFTTENHLRIAKTLKLIKGKFVLSYYDHKKVRELYKNFRIIKKRVPKYSVKSRPKGRKPLGTELLILNY